MAVDGFRWQSLRGGGIDNGSRVCFNNGMTTTEKIQWDGSLSALQYHTLVGTPGSHIVRNPIEVEGTRLMARHASRIRAAAKRDGRRVHINTLRGGSLLVTVR